MQVESKRPKCKMLTSSGAHDVKQLELSGTPVTNALFC